MKQLYTISDVKSAESSLNPATTSLTSLELSLLAEKQQNLIRAFDKCRQEGIVTGLGMFPSEEHLINYVVNAYLKCGIDNYKNDRINLYFGAQIICSFIHAQPMPYSNFYGYDISYYTTPQAGADLPLVQRKSSTTTAKPRCCNC